MGWIIAVMALLSTLIGVVVGGLLGVYGVMLWSKNKPEEFDKELKSWRDI